MTKFTKFYIKHIVKSSCIYIVFVLLSIGTCIVLSLNTKVAVIETFNGNFGEKRLIINEVVDYPIDKAYVYKNRDDVIITCDVLKSKVIDDNYTVIYIKEIDTDINLDGVIKVDVEKKHTSLFNIIIGKDKRYVEKDLR